MNQEIEKPQSQGGFLDKAFNVLVANPPLADLISVRENREVLEETNDVLKQGCSVLVVANHPTTTDTIFVARQILELTERDPSETGVFISRKFGQGRMGSVGNLIKQALIDCNIEPLEIEQRTVEGDPSVRAAFNRLSLTRGSQILSSKSGVLVIFPEGTRSSPLIQAQAGLSAYAAKADYVLPITTRTWLKVASITPPGREKTGKREQLGIPQIHIHPLQKGKDRIKALVNGNDEEPGYGKEIGYQMYADTIMLTIAQTLDRKERGFYTEPADLLEKVMMGTLSQDEYSRADPRWQKLLTEYFELQLN